MADVVIFGSGQGGALHHVWFTHDTPHTVVAFTVDQAYIKADKLCGLPVVPFEHLESLYPPDKVKMAVCISYVGVNKLRAAKYAEARARGYQFANCISSKATVYPGAVLGDNCIVGPNAQIDPFVRIGDDVFIGPGSLVGHNSIIGDHCFVGPHAVILGSTTIEPYCVIGANATIRDGGVRIARECIIGAGTFIKESTIEKGVYLSRPADLVPKRSDELSDRLVFRPKT